MQKLRKAIVAACSVAMVLGTMGVGAASAASSTTTCVSRAQFIYDFDVAAGIMPVYPATSDFSDVASSSPYYGYIEAAFKAGYVSGTGNGQFSPNGCLTRGQIAKIEVLALGDGAAATADATSATTFTDDSAIPSWARGYVVEALAVGLVHGYPDGSYGPNASMTSSDETFFLSQYKTVENALALTVTASASDVAPGQQVTLTATGTNEPVTYSTTSGAVINGSTFVGSTAGNYTVTASTADGLKGTVSISVYGAAVGLKINTPSSAIVANGMSTYTVAVDVVDANGNTVANSTDTIALTSSVGGVATVTSPAGGSEDAVNGVATFTLTAGTIPGGTSVLDANDASLTPKDYTATITSTAQVATSLKVTAPAYVEANDTIGTGTASVEVDDQTGNPMVAGTYAVSLSLTGPATFAADGTTGPESGAFVNSADASFNFESVQSETGAITFTASATGLTSGTGTTTAVIAGTPSTITATGNGTTFADAASSLTNQAEIDLGLVDSHGYPAGALGNITVTVTGSTGATGSVGVSTTSGSGYSYNANGVSITAAALATSGGALYFADTTLGGGNADAGSYTVTITDASGNSYTAPSPVTITETAGSAYALAVTPGTVDVPASAPNATFTAQIVDFHGNPVSDSGVVVTFAGDGNYGFTLGGVSSGGPGPYIAAATATTGSDGSATVTLDGQPYTTALYTVVASGTDGNILLNSGDGIASVKSTVASNVSVSATDTNGGSSYYFTAGDTINVTATVTDQYSTPVPGDLVTINASGAGLCDGAAVPPSTTCTQTGTVTPGGTPGTYVASFTAEATGPVTITAQDTSVAAAPKSTASATVAAGSIAWFDFFDASGTDVTGASGTTYAAGTQVELWLKPVDAYGNATVADKTYYVSLDGTLGEWRSTASGSDILTATLNAGQSEVAVYFTPLNADPALEPSFGLSVSWNVNVATVTVTGASVNWSGTQVGATQVTTTTSDQVTFSTAPGSTYTDNIDATSGSEDAYLDLSYTP